MLISFFWSAIDFSPIADFAGWVIYALLAGLALWGAYCTFLLRNLVKKLMFKSEEEQEGFLDEIDNLWTEQFSGGTSDKSRSEIVELCKSDPRALPQLTLVAMENLGKKPAKIQEKLVERFRRDVLSEISYRLGWVQTIIKGAPMAGLFGTVIGMMGAFSKLASATQVSPDKLASDIMLALITTACGMAVAIPLILAIASVSTKISQLEDFISSGLVRILEMIKTPGQM